MTSKTRNPNKTLQDGVPEQAEQDRVGIRTGQRSVNNNDTSGSKVDKAIKTPTPLMDGSPNNEKPIPKPKQEGDNPKDLDQPEEKWDEQTPEK